MNTMSETAAQEFLAAKHVAVLSVAAINGRPPASVPMWYDYTPGGDVVFNTGAGSRKAKLLERAGNVTLVVQDEEPPYKYVVVECSIVATTTPAPVPVREEIATRYLGEERGKQFVAGIPAESSALFTVRPERWITADFTGAL